MRVFSALWLATSVCGVAEHSHHGESEAETEGQKQVPLLETEFVQDGPEELERKWSFEVCRFCFDLASCSWIF
jgi:hypothetical protein